jgi:hypothetical protein
MFSATNFCGKSRNETRTSDEAPKLRGHRRQYPTETLNMQDIVAAQLAGD